MLKTLQVSAVALTAAASFGIASAAGLSEDMNNCRAAIDEAGLFGDAEYTLDFVKDLGNREFRTVDGRRISLGSADRMERVE